MAHIFAKFCPAMFTVIQSNDTQILAKHLSQLYKAPLSKGGSIFDPFLVIVPAMVLDEWLKKTIAKHSKISTLITTQFWGQYQWQLIDKVLKCDINAQTGQEPLSVPDMAVLSQSVIRWRIFAYLMGGAVNGVTHNSVISNGTTSETGHANTAITVATLALSDDTHPLHELLSTLTDPSGTLSTEVLWRFCDTLARLYVQYLTERTDWLHTWAMGGRLDVPAMIAKKDALSQALNRPEWQEPSPSTDKKQSTDDEHATPAWLAEHYVALEKALAFLWWTLFAQVFLYRERLETRFWELLADKAHPNHTSICQTLPKTIHLFTVQQLPQTELNFLKKLSTYTDVVLLHFNPSAMFWADIVDKNWLATQRIIRPQAVYLKDYGHGLLSRLGKASRETFAMLADMAGGELSADFVVNWQDDFNEFEDKVSHHQAKPTLLTALKKDIAMLEEQDFGEELGDFWQTLENKAKPQTQFYFTKQDDSLLIHNCHSIKRELEIARTWIGRWLNEPNADGTPRKLSDVAIMLPDVESHKELLFVMFSETAGLDGLVLPATITGVQDKALHELWTAIFGIFSLTAGRFYYQEFCEWLFNPYVHETFGMDMAMAVRASDLLKEAGFVRGLHEQHLQETLDKHDRDYRVCFAYALDRLVASLSMREVTSVLYPFVWQADTTPQKTATLPNVRLEDEPIVHGLCRIYQAFVAGFGVYETYRPLQEWLVWLEYQVINRYFYRYQGEEVMRGIFNVMNGLKSSVRANFYYTKFGQSPITHELALPLKFVLETIATAIQTQKISAETSDVIQIGRFGSLRGMSFGLVVMVGMNLSEFPRTEPISRLDLSKAGLPRRGDRVSEDDDNGAFLEAILQARENCWIFYSGQTHDGSERLPATPVGELLQFIKSSIKDDTEQQTDKTPDPLPTHDTSAIFEHIIIRHPALPFERGLFEMVETAPVPIISMLSPPPAPLWQAVYQKSQKRLSKSAPIALPTHEALMAIRHQLINGQWDDAYLAQKGHVDNHTAPIVLTGLIADITKPNRAYLKGRMVRLAEYQEDKEEALALNGLDNLRIGELMLQAQLVKKAGQPPTDHLRRELARLPYEPTLPAGANKELALQQLTHKADTLIETFFTNQHQSINTLHLPTPTEQGLHKITLVHSGQHVSILAKLPSPKETVWRNIVPKKLTPAEQVSAFIYHVAWQLIRPPQEFDDKAVEKSQAGASFWQFLPNSDSKKANFLHFAPMSYQTACLVFGRFLTFAKLLKYHPLALTPDNALHQLASDDPNTPAKATLDTWVAKPYGYVPNSSSFHKDWQVILADTDPITALEACLPLIPVLYQELFNTLVVR